MIVVKMPVIKEMPDGCDDCYYFGVRPHPYKGWTNECELCTQCLDDDQEEGWVYDGDSRPKNCPLLEVEDCQSDLS